MMLNIFGIEPGAIPLGLVFQAFSLKFFGRFLGEFLGASPQGLMWKAFSLCGSPRV